MSNVKQFMYLSFILLAACAPPKASFDIGSLKQAKQQEQSVETTTTTSTPTTETKSTTKNSKKKLAALPTTEETTAKEDTKSKIIASASHNVPGSWDLSGAMATKSKNKAWTASLNWLQRGSGTYQIRLNGPLGSGAILIEKKGSMVTYHDGPKAASSSNADELLSQQTGIRLPVNNLYYWVRGIPAPGAVQMVKRDGANNIQILKQAGYTIQYGGYAMINKASLPTQIRLQGNGVFIKLVVKHWSV